MAQERPHLVLYWTFDIPNYRLYIDIDKDLTYEAIEGGTLGFKKIYKNKETHVSLLDWEEKEKFWISENYGEKYGYFQPDHERYVDHPKWGWEQKCVNGLGADGEYLDHMQRSQYVLEAHDVSLVHIARDKTVFETPDCGKTIFKRLPTRDVNYPDEMKADKDAYWPEWAQACLMQPRTQGYRLSSIDELERAGCPTDAIEKCLAGEWDAPTHPELQKYYVYPTK